MFQAVQYLTKRKITAKAVIFRGTNVYRHLLHSRRFFGKGEGFQREGRLKKTVYLHVILIAWMRGNSHLQFHYSMHRTRMQCKIVI